MNSAILVDHLSKRYQLGSRGGRGPYRTLRESIVDTAAKAFRRLRKQSRNGKCHEKPGPHRPDETDREICALKDVSFEVKPGEVLGIIGRNGAGKSTLLKVLSRITRPTRGEVLLRGRVRSLLEVGTGFHPELTGRENIFLNGSILGMSRTEVKRKFDEIVAFSEIERFLDTPVKRYSSGMYVRLAFAVAAHLDSEILLVDEVLAVGDAGFQSKCLGKVKDISSGGRTVFFVSHNMAAVQNLCQRVLILKDGALFGDGQPNDCIARYLQLDKRGESVFDLRRAPSRPLGRAAVFTELEIADAQGRIGSPIRSGDGVIFRMWYDRLETSAAIFTVTVLTLTGVPVVSFCTRWNDCSARQIPPRGCAICKIPELPLTPGEYLLTLGCGDIDDYFERLECAASLTVQPRDYFGTGYCPPLKYGAALLRATWEVV
jgi:lipopolysaccharide transport system ATP-binding protein